MAQLEGQVALVTGGGSGIGRAVVDRYVEEGARVCIMDISAERLAELSRLYGERVIGVQGDATTVEANERAVRQTVEKFSKLDVFVANAGLGDAFRELIDIPTADVPRVYKEIFDLNVLAVIIGARVAVKELVKTQGSIIVTLSARTRTHPTRTPRSRRSPRSRCTLSPPTTRAPTCFSPRAATPRR